LKVSNGSLFFYAFAVAFYTLFVGFIYTGIVMALEPIGKTVAASYLIGAAVALALI
jgi:hypothetical protein